MNIFLYSSSVYFCYLFLKSSASVRSLPFLSFIEPIFAWNVPLVPLIFLNKSLVFLFYCFPVSLHTEEGFFYLSLLFSETLYSDVYMFPFLLCLFPYLLSTAVCKASSGNHFAFLHCFCWGWCWSLPPVQCHEAPYIVLQALCLSDLIPWIYLSEFYLVKKKLIACLLFE